MVTLTVYVLYSIAAVSVRYCDSVALTVYVLYSIAAVSVRYGDTVYVVSVRYGDTHCLFRTPMLLSVYDMLTLGVQL